MGSASNPVPAQAVDTVIFLLHVFCNSKRHLHARLSEIVPVVHHLTFVKSY